MKSLRDEILLRRDKRTDLISSEAQPKISSEQRSDFIALARFHYPQVLLDILFSSKKYMLFPSTFFEKKYWKSAVVEKKFSAIAR